MEWGMGHRQTELHSRKNPVVRGGGRGTRSRCSASTLCPIHPVPRAGCRCLPGKAVWTLAPTPSGLHVLTHPRGGPGPCSKKPSAQAPPHVCPQAQMHVSSYMPKAGSKGGDPLEERPARSPTAASVPISGAVACFICVYLFVFLSRSIFACVCLSAVTCSPARASGSDRLSLLPPPEAGHAHARTQQKQLRASQRFTVCISSAHARV